MNTDDIIKKLGNIQYKSVFKTIYIDSLPNDFEERVANRNFSIESLLSNIFAPRISLTFSNPWNRRSIYRMFFHSVFNKIIINTFENIQRASHLFVNSIIDTVQLDVSTMSNLKSAFSMFDNATIEKIIVKNKEVSNFSPIEMSSMFENVDSIRKYIDIIESIKPNESDVYCTNMFQDAFIDTGFTLNIKEAKDISGMFENAYCQLLAKEIDMRLIYVNNKRLYNYRDALAIAPIENRKICAKFILNKSLEYPKIIDEMLGKSYLYNNIQIISKPHDDYFVIAQTERDIK